MNRLYFLLLIIFSFNSCDHNTQSFFVDYTPSEAAKSYFVNDATSFAMENLFVEKSSDTLLIDVPSRKVDTYLNALGLLYDNMNQFSELDSVINKLSIHKESWQTHDIGVFVDTNYQWVKNIRAGLTTSGNLTVDSLSQIYNLSFNTSLLEWARVIGVTSAKPINGKALVYTFEKIPGVGIAEPYTMFLIDKKLTFKLEDETALVSFYQGYIDCYVGCLYYDRWDFEITNDSNIRFKGTFVE